MAVELDGDDHAGHRVPDAIRTHFLNRRGIDVFTNRDVYMNLDGVRQVMALKLARLGGLTPT